MGKTKMMKAAVVYAQNDIRYDDYPEPAVCPGTVKIHVRACGICGSDIPRALGTAAHFYPVVLGHEFSGEIAETGEGVTDFHIGDQVVCASLIPCYRCPDCLRGQFSLCKHYTFIGSRIQGAMADYVVVPAENVIRLKGTGTFEEAALIEPASVALHGVLKSDFHGGKNVAIVGAGTIGIFVAQWTALLGAKKVVCLDVDDDRLALAKDIAACEGINVLTRNVAEEVKELTNGVGFDYVFGVSGASASYKTALKITANKACVCFIGTPTQEIAFSIEEWELINRRELWITGSWMSYTAPFPGSAWTMCVEYLANGRLKCDSRMIYRKYSMSQCKEAFACYEYPEQVKGRILLVNEAKE